MPQIEDVLFGRVALKHRLVDATILRECSEIVERRGGDELGKVLVAKGHITPKKYRAVAAEVKVLVKRARGTGPARKGDSGAASPGGSAVHASAVEARDFSHLVGQSLDTYLEEARKLGASDLHFQVGARPFVRLHGEIVYLSHPVLRSGETEARIEELLDDDELWTFEQKSDFDFCYEADHGRYRTSVFRQRKGGGATFRVVPQQVPTLSDLHLPEVLSKFAECRQGLVLITGPAGSGKTATAAALLDVVNQHQYDHIVTVENPIEYVLESKNCIVNQRSVGRHTKTYQTALRSAMRSDPDYIFIGEMRDLETMRIAITAAETGHLVFATLHTTSAVRSVDRIIDVFPSREQDQIRGMVSESLRGVVSQQLLPRTDKLGREPAVEIFFTTAAAAKLIRERKTHQLRSVIEMGSRDGMMTMDDSIDRLLRERLITRETALKCSQQKDRFDP